MRALRALSRLSVHEWLVLLRTTLLAVAVETSLRFESLPSTARRFGCHLELEPAPGSADADPVDVLTRRELADLLLIRRVLKRGPFNGTCLRQALSQGFLLRRRRPVLRVGVAKVDGTVTAHAWLEVAGASLDPTGASRFEILRAVPPPSHDQRH